MDAGVRHMRIDGIFHNMIMYVKHYVYNHELLDGKDAKQIDEMYREKYKEDHVTSGFYYTKTSKVKVGE